MKTRILLKSAALVAIFSAGVQAGDSLEAIKERLAAAACTRIEFLSTIESDIFDQTDSAYGVAYIAADGRYWVQLGGDQYWHHSGKLWSYSAEHAQVTVESLPDDEESFSQISFITQLDDHYRTDVITPNHAYRLLHRKEAGTALPDSVILYLDESRQDFDRLEYYDVNEELNRFIILQMNTSDHCDEIRFAPSFPDSTELIRIN